MRFNASAHADAHEAVGIEDRTDLATSILYTGDFRSDGLYVKGTPAQRADFLRRLATAATDAADELVPRVEVVGVPAVKFGEWSGGAL